MSALSERINAANHQGWKSRRIEAEAKKAGFTLSNATAHKILTGTHGLVTDDSLRALEALFGVDFGELRGLLDLPADAEPWEPPLAAARLTHTQRELLEALIHQLVKPAPSAATVDEVERRRLLREQQGTKKKAARKTTDPRKK